MISRMTSLAYTPRPRRPLTAMRRTLRGPIARHCDASTSRTCDVPMPKATAPNAPCVDVWLSPQAIVIPGCVNPSSGPITWTIPCWPLAMFQQPDPVLAAVPLERRQHVFRHHVEERPPLIERGDDVIDGADGALRHRDAEPAGAQHVERLRRRDLVDQVEADEELVLTVRKRADGMRVPDLFEQCCGHCGKGDPSTVLSAGAQPGRGGF